MSGPDVSDLFSSLLSDPEKVARAMEVLRRAADTTAKNEANGEGSPAGAGQRTDGNMTGTDGAGTASAVPDIKEILPAAKPAEEPNPARGGDRYIALLSALRPYLSAERRDKVDRILRFLRLAELAGGPDFFRGV